MDVGPWITRSSQHIEPPLRIAQLPDQLVKRVIRPRRRQLGGHPQRQRQPGASSHQKGSRDRFGPDPVPDEPAQQCKSVLGRQQVQVHPPRAVQGDQTGQRVTTGDQDEAGRRSRQQRPDLFDVTGVVDNDEYATSGQRAAKPCGARLDRCRNGRRSDTEPMQEPAQCLRWIHRLLRVVTTEIHIELAIGELIGHVVRPMHRQRGLTNPGGPRHRRNDDRTGPGNRPRCPKQVVQNRQLSSPPGEGVDVGRKLLGNVTDGSDGGLCCGQRRVGFEDLLVQPLRLWAGVDAKLPGQPQPKLLVLLQRLGLAAAPIQRQQQLSGQPLVQRVLRGGLQQHGQQGCVPPPA